MGSYEIWRIEYDKFIITTVVLILKNIFYDQIIIFPNLVG